MSAALSGETGTTITVNDDDNRLLLPVPPRAPDLAHSITDKKLYWDRSHYDSPAAQLEALTKSSTCYVGNLSFTTKTSHVWTHFARHIGPVKNVVLGLDRSKKSPCGFCFVEFVHRHDALAAVSHGNATKLNGKIIRVELDAGFKAGRQYGRGVKGGQVRDDRRVVGAPAAPVININNKREKEEVSSMDQDNGGADDVEGDAEVAAPRAKRQRMS